MFTSRVMTVHDVMERTGWSKKKIRALMRSGKLGFDSSAGKRPTYNVTSDELEAFLSKQQKNADN